MWAAERSAKKIKLKKYKYKALTRELKQASAAERRAVNLERAQRMAEEKKVTRHIYMYVYINIHIHIEVSVDIW